MNDRDDAVEGSARLVLVEEEQLLPQLVAHLREHRSKLREEWVGRLRNAHLLEAADAAAVVLPVSVRCVVGVL